MNFFMNLKNTSYLTMIITEEWLNEMKRDNAIEEWLGDLNPRIHETSTTWKILSLTKTTDQTQEEDLHPEKVEEQEDHRDSRITT
jgi:hypothetical protein